MSEDVLAAFAELARDFRLESIEADDIGDAMIAGGKYHAYRRIEHLLRDLGYDGDV